MSDSEDDFGMDGFSQEFMNDLEKAEEVFPCSFGALPSSSVASILRSQDSTAEDSSPASRVSSCVRVKTEPVELEPIPTSKYTLTKSIAGRASPPALIVKTEFETGIQPAIPLTRDSGSSSPVSRCRGHSTMSSNSDSDSDGAAKSAKRRGATQLLESDSDPNSDSAVHQAVAKKTATATRNDSDSDSESSSEDSDSDSDSRASTRTATAKPTMSTCLSTNDARKKIASATSIGPKTNATTTSRVSGKFVSARKAIRNDSDSNYDSTSTSTTSSDADSDCEVVHVAVAKKQQPVGFGAGVHQPSRVAPKRYISSSPFHKRKRSESTTTSSDSDSDVEVKFFSSYPKFEYDPSGPASQQYQALKSIVPKNRGTGGDVQGKYGHDVNSLESWQKLCCAVEFSPIPNCIKECQQLIEDAHVNIIDLLDMHTTREPVHRFATEKRLSCYTKETGKILLKYLLRYIICPPPEHLMRHDGQLVERNS
ncbi:hypothetical protein C8J57DRAFT_1404092 [Mycena rebaudengoi]|nr:hypothetical protein C8J57DRAFT_1404092 [Mycena rebaudengoi]